MSTDTAFLIDTDTLAQRLEDPAWLVLDVSAGPVPGVEGDLPAHDAYLARHIPGAKWVDQKATLSLGDSPFGFMSPAPEVLADAFQALGIGTDTQVVLYSANGYGWSTRVWWLLRSIGFTNARVLDGGLQKWLAEGRSLAQGNEPSRPSTPLESKRLRVTSLPVFVGRKEVEAAVRTREPVLVDALSPAQYDGTAPSRHGRRGHIAGAINLPAARFVDASNQTFIPAAEAAALLRAAGVTPQSPVITYCGGGIAASTVAFAVLRAGVRNVSIYDASLAEWARDPSLPMDPVITEALDARA